MAYRSQQAVSVDASICFTHSAGCLRTAAVPSFSTLKIVVTETGNTPTDTCRELSLSSDTSRTADCFSTWDKLVRVSRQAIARSSDLQSPLQEVERCEANAYPHRPLHPVHAKPLEQPAHSLFSEHCLRGHRDGYERSTVRRYELIFEVAWAVNHPY